MAHNPISYCIVLDVLHKSRFLLTAVWKVPMRHVSSPNHQSASSNGHSLHVLTSRICFRDLNCCRVSAFSSFHALFLVLCCPFLNSVVESRDYMESSSLLRTVRESHNPLEVSILPRDMSFRIKGLHIHPCLRWLKAVVASEPSERVHVNM